MVHGIQNHAVVGNDAVGNQFGGVGTDPVFDDSFTLKNTVVSLSDIALELVICLSAIAGASDRFSELHIINQVEHMDALEDGIVFK